ncbi:hypothetical protein [Radiobacillus sp. PE A8.2]|uniref:hypothetical protein n=1 Tax=Radiobacillus sp. PE A8.2 TaxID=3380349 RepID=UPI00388F4BB5
MSGCNNQNITPDYHLPLSGNSNHWQVSGYEMSITPEEFKIDNGTISFKNERRTDSFSFNTHAIINGTDETIHHKSVTAMTASITEESTGGIESVVFKNNNGEPITLEDVNEVYMIVSWRDIQSEKNINERITLYSKSDNEQSSE